MNRNNNLNPRTLVYTPTECSNAYVEHAKRIAANPGLTWGVGKIDRVTIPMRCPDVVSIVARAGHGKSSLSAYLIRKTAKELITREAVNECVVYASLEQNVEEIEAFFQLDGTYNVTDFAFGRVPIDVITTGAVKRIGNPIWMLGKSMNRRRQSPPMTIDNIYRAVETIETDYKIKPILIVIDYIQIVPVEHARERYEQVGEAIARAKTDLAPDSGCPVVLCVQAGRQVDARDSKVPGPADCQHSSAIEQASDKGFGLWRPALTEPLDNPAGKRSFVEVGNEKIPVTQQTLIMKMWKQRFAAAGHMWALSFAPEYVRLAELELRDYD